jgi:hypothetical protein
MWQSTSRYPALLRRTPRGADRASMVWLEVDAASSQCLREVVIRAGGDAARFLRIDACSCSAGRAVVRALLCVEPGASAALRAEVLRRLPQCVWQAAARRGDHVHAC